MVMTRYDKIVNLGEEFLVLVQSGLVSIILLDWKVYYEYYINQMELQRKNFTKPRKIEAMHLTADHYDLSKRHVERIVAFMESKPTT